MFTGEGHIDIAAKDLLAAARTDLRTAVNDYLLAGTPRVFATYANYCNFLRELGIRLQVHPRSIVVRGSTLLGFSTSPKRAKVWQSMRDGSDGSKPSDIDLAIVDFDYYERIDDAVRRWDERQGVPSLSGDERNRYLRRTTLRRYYCCDDEALPRGTCEPHLDAVRRFDARPYCVRGVPHPVGGWVFRDWWSLRLKAEQDIRELVDKVGRDELPEPP
jgi:hypothetical protein